MNQAAMILLAANLVQDPTTGQLLVFVLKGLAVVLFTLSFLAGSCGVAGYLLRARAEQKNLPSHGAPKQATSPAGIEEFEEPSDELLAVIGAACAVAIDQPHRIVHIGGLVPEDQAWSLEGRFQHHTSHTILHRDNR